MNEKLHNDGFEIKRAHLDKATLSALQSELVSLSAHYSAHGVRNLFNVVPSIYPLIRDTVIHSIIGSSFFPIRTLYFDKLPGKNWNVAWHQDVTVGLLGDSSVPGFKNVSIKSDHFTAEPPSHFLNDMMTLRVHLDDANIDNGCLRVVSGSHKRGRVSSNEILSTLTEESIKDVVVKQGDVMVMKPLLFHSSRKSTSLQSRRVIHIECCSVQLPKGLSWYETIPEQHSHA